MFTETVEQVDAGLARLLEAVRAGELTAARLKDLVAASRSWEAKVTALQTDVQALEAGRAHRLTSRPGHNSVLHSGK